MAVVTAACVVVVVVAAAASCGANAVNVDDDDGNHTSVIITNISVYKLLKVKIISFTQGLIKNFPVGHFG
jgi:hypothetical protein